MDVDVDVGYSVVGLGWGGWMEGGSGWMGGCVRMYVYEWVRS